MSFIAACIQKCTDCNQKKETELEGDNEVVQNPAHMVQEKAPPANPNEAAETAVAPNLEEEVRAKATGVCIEGYLMRQSREGKWKKRFYETVEENGWWMLVYYKTPEREKILNAVKLHRTSQVKREGGYTGRRGRGGVGRRHPRGSGAIDFLPLCCECSRAASHRLLSAIAISTGRGCSGSRWRAARCTYIKPPAKPMPRSGWRHLFSAEQRLSSK